MLCANRARARFVARVQLLTCPLFQRTDATFGVAPNIKDAEDPLSVLTHHILSSCGARDSY